MSVEKTSSTSHAADTGTTLGKPDRKGPIGGLKSNVYEDETLPRDIRFAGEPVAPETPEEARDEVLLPADELDDIAGEETMSLGELGGEASLEAARASGYTEDMDRPGSSLDRETPHRGHETGAYTDIGAGRSGSTRSPEERENQR